MRLEGIALRPFLPFRFPLRLLLATMVLLAATPHGGCAVLSTLAPSPEPGPALQPSAAPAWYGQNGPIIKAYLESLPRSSIGKELPGIRLSDGKLWLEGYTYLGPGRNLPPGLSARFFRQGTSLYAYLWLAEGAEPLQLTSCGAGPQKGIRARQAGGGVFAWKQLSAKAGVVYTECPPSDWLPPGAQAVLPGEANGKPSS